MMMTKKLFLSLLLMSSISAFAQNNIDELSTVWSKTYGSGSINSIKPNADGTYTATGQTWNSSTPAGIQKLEGLIIEFDESGNELRRATARIPQSYLDTHTDLSAAFAEFKVAQKTDDGGYLSIGRLHNAKAPDAEMVQGDNTGNYLRNGIWVVKFDSLLNVTRNVLDVGCYPEDLTKLVDSNYLLTGYGYSNGNATMISKYNQSGVLVANLTPSTYYEATRQCIPAGGDNYWVLTSQYLLTVNMNSGVTSATLLNSKLGTIKAWGFQLSKAADGGFFVMTDLNNDSNSVTDYNNGRGTFKLNNSIVLQYSKKRIPADTVFSAPLLLPNSTNKYIGTASTQMANGSTLVNTGNYIYELTDNGAFTYRVGDQYPNNTQLRIAGQTDGFFSSGMSNEGLAAIAKLSACATFKLSNIGKTQDTLVANSQNAVIVAGKNLAYEGSHGIVSRQWTLSDVTPGGSAIANWANVVKSDTSNIPAQKFTLADGKSYAKLNYEIVITDSISASTTCRQTYVVMVDIYRQLPLTFDVASLNSLLLKSQVPSGIQESYIAEKGFYYKKTTDSNWTKVVATGSFEKLVGNLKNAKFEFQAFLTTTTGLTLTSKVEMIHFQCDSCN